MKSRFPYFKEKDTRTSKTCKQKNKHKTLTCLSVELMWSLHEYDAKNEEKGYMKDCHEKEGCGTENTAKAQTNLQKEKVLSQRGKILNTGLKLGNIH